MITDTHTHFVLREFDLLEGLPPRTASASFDAAEKAIGILGKYGIGRAWACTLEGLVDDTAPYNRFLCRLARRYPVRVAPFCTVNPHLGERAVQEFREMVLKRGMKGLKLHNWLQAVSNMSRWVERLVDEAGRMGVPVLFHDGTPPYATPLQIARLAGKFPHTTVVLGHSGLQDLYPDAIRAAKQHANIYLCACSASHEGLKRMVDRVGPGRILFGTDGGFGDFSGLVELHLDLVDSLGLGAEDREKILWKNAHTIVPDPHTAGPGEGGKTEP